MEYNDNGIIRKKEVIFATHGISITRFLILLYVMWAFTMQCWRQKGEKKYDNWSIHHLSFPTKLINQVDTKRKINMGSYGILWDHKLSWDIDEFCSSTSYQYAVLQWIECVQANQKAGCYHLLIVWDWLHHFNCWGFNQNQMIKQFSPCLDDFYPSKELLDICWLSIPTNTQICFIGKVTRRILQFQSYIRFDSDEVAWTELHLIPFSSCSSRHWLFLNVTWWAKEMHLHLDNWLTTATLENWRWSQTDWDAI